MPIIVCICLFFQMSSHFLTFRYFWFSPLTALCIPNIVLSQHQHNLSCLLKTPLWKISFQLEALKHLISDEMFIDQTNTYQRPFLIIIGSLLALLVWVAVAGKNRDQHFKSSAQKIAEGAGVFVDYQVDTAISALAKDIFGLGTVSQNDKVTICKRIKKLLLSNFILFYCESLT